jgi:hypothetical protein
VVEFLLALVRLQKHICRHVDNVFGDKTYNLRPFVSAQDTGHQSKDKQLPSQKDGAAQDPSNFLVVATAIGISKQVVSASFRGDAPPNELTNNNEKLYHEHFADCRWQEDADR